MMHIEIFTNPDKDKDFLNTKALIKLFTEKGISCSSTSESISVINTDLIVSVGGDGTFLKAARQAASHCIPIIGLNTGTLGFLTEGDMSEASLIVEKIAAGNYSIGKRMMLKAHIVQKDSVKDELALNDIVVSRHALSRILNLKAYVNDFYVEYYTGDGMIISSPTGSTAYSLSAGGPIVEPTSQMLIMTPVCPHMLNTRSLILTSESSVKLIIDEKYQSKAMVTIDGQVGYEVAAGDYIEVSRYPVDLLIARTGSCDFFKLIRMKIYDGGEATRRNEEEKT